MITAGEVGIFDPAFVEGVVQTAYSDRRGQIAPLTNNYIRRVLMIDRLTNPAEALMLSAVHGFVLKVLLLIRPESLFVISQPRWSKDLLDIKAYLMIYQKEKLQ